MVPLFPSDTSAILPVEPSSIDRSSSVIAPASGVGGISVNIDGTVVNDSEDIPRCEKLVQENSASVVSDPLTFTVNCCGLPPGNWTTRVRTDRAGFTTNVPVTGNAGPAVIEKIIRVASSW